MYMEKNTLLGTFFQILILHLSYNVPTFSESNALDFCLMTGILENVPSPFQSVPTIFWRLAVMSLKMMDNFQMTF